MKEKNVCHAISAQPSVSYPAEWNIAPAPQELYFPMWENADFCTGKRAAALDGGERMPVAGVLLYRVCVENEDVPREQIVLWISASYLERVFCNEIWVKQCFHHTAGHARILRLGQAQFLQVKSLLATLRKKDRNAACPNSLCAAGVLIHILLMLWRGDGFIPRGQECGFVFQILQYINEHYMEEINLAELSQRFYVSKYYLSHEFRKSVGYSVCCYIRLRRLLMAREMLLLGVSPGRAAFCCGFQEYSNFYRAFKGYYGVSPRSYEARAHGKETGRPGV